MTPHRRTTSVEDPGSVSLKSPELYINRELSLLEFNRRVFEQAKDGSNPLLARLRFLCIASTNLDEFFEIRVSGLNEQVKYGSVQTGEDNMMPVETLKKLARLRMNWLMNNIKFSMKC